MAWIIKIDPNKLIKKNGAKFAQSLSLHAPIYASSSSYYEIIATA
ncbi:hypothetical protein [Virgibacillus sp. Bac332]|nr:hypothetical protein [Virgibacillus sp. Bac332]